MHQETDRYLTLLAMDNTKFHKARVFVNAKTKAVLPAEAAQLQKDLAEIRTRPTPSLSRTHLKDHLLALSQTSIPDKDFALYLSKWLAMNKTFQHLPVYCCPCSTVTR